MKALITTLCCINIALFIARAKEKPRLSVASAAILGATAAINCFIP